MGADRLRFVPVVLEPRSQRQQPATM